MKYKMCFLSLFEAVYTKGEPSSKTMFLPCGPGFDFKLHLFTWSFTSNTNWLSLSGSSLELNNAAHNYLVQRYGVFDHAPQTVDDGRESDSTRCITIAVHFGPSSRKIEHCTALQRKVILNLLETTLSWNERCSRQVQTSAPKSDDRTRHVDFQRCLDFKDRSSRKLKIWIPQVHRFQSLSTFPSSFIL